MLLTEDPVIPLPVHPLDLKEIVVSPRALNVERDLAPGVLALDTGSTVTFATDYALQVEPLSVDTAHPYWRLGSHYRSWNPHGTAEMNPLVESLCGHGFVRFKLLFVSLEEEGVVFGDLCDGF